MGSHLELKKFKRYWEELYGNPIEMPDDSITKHITQCGIIHEGKVYMPQEMLDEEIKTGKKDKYLALELFLLDV